MMANLNHRLGKMKLSLNVCLCLKMALHASIKVNRVVIVVEEVLAHCEKRSTDSVELVGLCKLLFFTILVAIFAVCLAMEILF